MTTNEIIRVAEIMKEAEAKLIDELGIEAKVSISLKSFLNDPENNPRSLLLAMTNEMDVPYQDIISANRKKEVVAARNACIFIIKTVFPEMGDRNVANLFSKERTVVISSCHYAKDKIDTNDILFMSHYNTAKKAADIWLQNLQTILSL